MAENMIDYPSFIRNKNELIPGDVLLGYTSALSDKSSEATGNGYSHAGIYLRDNKIAQSSSSGVKIISPEDMICEYEHIAILRRPYIWNNTRLKKLEYFINEAVSRGSSFNLLGVKKFEKRKNEQDINVYQQLVDYFDGNLDLDSPVKNAYFCSELVVSAFIYTGIIEENLSVVINPKTTSPADIAREALFGHFWGYLIVDTEYEIPEDDEFYHTLTLVYP